LYPSAFTSSKDFEQQLNPIPPGETVQSFVESKGFIELCAPSSAWGNSENQSGSVSPHSKKGSKTMPLIQILLALIVVGVLLWLVNRFIPMQGTIKSILNAVVVIGVVLWLLDAFGLFHSLSRIRVGT
jgi:hypothetical protein